MTRCCPRWSRQVDSARRVASPAPARRRRSTAAVSLGIFSAVQATWNLHERAAEDALARCGLKVIVKEAMANGRLADRDAEALAAALAQPWATVVLSGAASVDVLRSNLRALETSDPGELLELKENSQEYWAARRHLQWN